MAVTKAVWDSMKRAYSSRQRTPLDPTSRQHLRPSTAAPLPRWYSRDETDAIEAKRLTVMNFDPNEFQKRRVELLEIETVNRFKWTVTQEFDVPWVEEDGEHADLPARQLVVSLGIYDKTRLPDLVARSASGTQLPVLGRQERGKILALGFLAQFRGGCFRKGLLNVASEIEIQALVRLVATVTAQSPIEARATAEATRELLGESAKWQLRCLARLRSFREGLEVLAEHIHVLAYLEARPRERVVITHTYTQVRPAIPYRSNFEVGVPWKALRRVLNAARMFLRFAGLIPLAVSRDNLNAEHVESYHVTLRAPDGLTIEDAYWQRSRPTHPDWEAILARQPTETFRRGTSTTLSAHPDDVVVEADRRSWFGLQLAPSSLLLAGTAVLGLVALVLGLTARLGMSCQADPTATQCTAGSAPNGAGLGVMLALPGLAAGVLAQARSRVTHKVARGPRTLTLIAAVIPYAVAVLLAFEQRTPADLVLLSRAGAAFAAFVAVLLLAVRFAPRRPSGTAMGPFGGQDTLRKSWYRQRDRLAALLFLNALGAGAVVYALL